MDRTTLVTRMISRIGVAQHETGSGSSYTATRRPIRLVWFEEFPTREEAKVVEAQIKKWNRRKKEALIGGKIDELKQAARKDWTLYRQRPSIRKPTRDSRS